MGSSRLILTAIVSCSVCASLYAADRTSVHPNIVLVIADDWSAPHAGAYGDKTARTPAFDRVAREGALFTSAFCAAPSCTPSRNAILTGQAPHRLEEGANLWSLLQSKFAVYPDLLEAAGYQVGLTGKGWGPGSFEAGGRKRNPAGPAFKSFEEFLKTCRKDQPFCFWFGSHDPHRPYEAGTGRKTGLDPAKVTVPPFFPDTPEVREDILDYYFEVERFDGQLAGVIAQLEAAGQLENTLLVVTSDNGMPFPRCKTNLYDSGSHMPLAIRWPGRIKPGTIIRDFVSLTDLAPSFLEAAGQPVPEFMTGRSLLPLLSGNTQSGRDRVFIERERHANTRHGNQSYPARAVRTSEFLYIRNPRPDRWPAGDPEMYYSVGPFGDIDRSPTKDVLLNRREDPKIKPFFDLACGKRPAEELYDLKKDPHQLTNVADQPEYADAKRKLSESLREWMTRTADPRAASDNDRFDGYQYFGAKGP